MTAAKVVRHVVLGLILAASHCRTFSLIHDYSAPLEAYKHLEHHEDVGVASMVCVGSVWHRFPSAFFVPEYVGEVRWLDDGFRGSFLCLSMLPWVGEHDLTSSHDGFVK
ncbi:hypothetical protein IFM89_013993 [Coptis chinensis]|uniref:Mannosyltransferase n=1 Tax=Coptis chinensis TaxID=261450 RepID=A0A835M5R7_9MAGN|nr:hypothetical protein IFM89_013993 [Coptis chinensis]